MKMEHPPTFTWGNPYAWPRKPLLAANVVSTSQPLAAQAGLQMLAAGERPEAFRPCSFLPSQTMA